MNTIARLSVHFSIMILLAVVAAATASAAIPADEFWDSKYYHAGIQGTVYSMLSRPGGLLVGGYISAVEGLPVQNVVRLNTSGGVVTGAVTLGDGLDNRVSDFCEYGGQVVAGGYFDHSGDTVLNRVALWDGAAWQPLGDGLPGVFVKSVAEYGGMLFAGAYAWDGVAWANVLQTDAGIEELIVQDGLLFVGGSFTEARGVPVNKVFAWDGVNVIPLGAGFPEKVISATASPTGPVFVTDSYQSYGKVFRWDGAAWVVERENTVPNAVGYFGTELIVSNSIYVSPHNFMPATQGNGTGSWVTFGSFTAQSMCQHEGVLFLQADPGDQSGVLSPGLIVYDGLGLQEAFLPGYGYSEGFHALASYGPGVLAGGDFAMADGQEFDGVGLSSGGSWSPFGDRSSLPVGTGRGPFVDLEFLGTSFFGVYTYYDWDISAEVLVKAVWNGAGWEWQSLPMAHPFYGDLVVVGAELFNVYFQGVRSVDPITGNLTDLPGLDLDGSIRGACSYQDELVICGQFTTNGGVPSSNVLRYSEGSWQDVGDALPGPVAAVAPMEGAGLAAAIGTYLEYRVALFDGVEWTVLEGIFDRAISNMVFHRGRLFAAGSFNMVGRTPAPGIAVWTGSEWAPVGSGLRGNSYGRVTDMVSAADHLWVAGDFDYAGASPSVGLAEWTGDPATLTGEPSGVQEGVPGAALLLGNPFPNPFNPVTTVSFELPRDARVRIGIYDVRGTRVCTLTDQDYSSGPHAVVWTGVDDSGQAQPSGVYFARLVVDDIQEVVKLTLVR